MHTRQKIKIKIKNGNVPEDALFKHFGFCSPQNGIWKDLCLTSGNHYDYLIIFNLPDGSPHDPRKTLVLINEPFTFSSINHTTWNPIEQDYLFVQKDYKSYPCITSWRMELSYRELIDYQFHKEKLLSTVTSAAYLLQGQKDRVNFLRYLDCIPIDIYGINQLRYAEHMILFHPPSSFKSHDTLKQYKGSLLQKKDGLTPYLYSFAGENSYEEGYFTEKLTDAILSECLCFYSGCPNINKYIDPEAYVQLDLRDMKSALDVVVQSINNQEYQKRYKAIKEAKRKLMNELNPLEIIRRMIQKEPYFTLPPSPSTEPPQSQ